MTEIKKPKTKMKRIEADRKIDKVVRAYILGLEIEGLNLTDQQLKEVEQKTRDISMKYIESAYELYE